MTKPVIYKLFLLFVLVSLIGPEIGLSYELFLLIDTFGIELFVIAAGAHLHHYWHAFESSLRKIDPYFFLSSPRKIVECPALLAHSIPGFMLTMLFATSLTIAST